MSKFWTVTAVLLLCGLFRYTDSQASIPSADEVLDNLSNVVQNPDLNNLNASVSPALEEAKNLFKQKCDKNGGQGAFENAKRAQEDMTECIKSLVNITELQAEMEKYKPTGDLDIVFSSYCRKRPIFKRCVDNFTTAIEPCLEEKEKDNKRIIQNITESLINFICFKEGDRIAIFISAGGPECLQSKQQEIQNCVNSTFGSYVPPVDPNSGSVSVINSLPSLVLGNRECMDITKLQTCIVGDLEKCPDPTPANIVDSIFNFILRVTPCESLLNTRTAAASDGRSSATHAVAFLLTMSVTSILLRFL